MIFQGGVALQQYNCIALYRQQAVIGFLYIIVYNYSTILCSNCLCTYTHPFLSYLSSPPYLPLFLPLPSILSSLLYTSLYTSLYPSLYPLSPPLPPCLPLSSTLLSPPYLPLYLPLSSPSLPPSPYLTSPLPFLFLTFSVLAHLVQIDFLQKSPTHLQTRSSCWDVAVPLPLFLLDRLAISGRLFM